MIKAQIAPRVRLRARIAGDVVSGALRLESKVAIPSTKRQYIKPSEGYNGLDTVIVEAVADANLIAFSPTQINPDELYSIGYNWFSQVVDRTQEIVGTNRNMTPAEIIYWLKRVKFVPQGWAITGSALDFDVDAISKLPVVVKSSASSTLVVNFETSARGETYVNE